MNSLAFTEREKVIERERKRERETGVIEGEERGKRKNDPVS